MAQLKACPEAGPWEEAMGRGSTLPDNEALGIEGGGVGGALVYDRDLITARDHHACIHQVLQRRSSAPSLLALPLPDARLPLLAAQRPHTQAPPEMFTAGTSGSAAL